MTQVNVTHVSAVDADEREGSVSFDVDRLAEQWLSEQVHIDDVLRLLAARLACRLGTAYSAQALLTLGLTMAKRETSWLHGASIASDGTPDGIPSATPRAALVLLLAHTLQLCATLLGEDELKCLLEDAPEGRHGDH